MTIALLLALALVATLLKLVRWRRTSLVLYFLTAIAFAGLGYGFPTSMFLADLQDQYATDSRDWGQRNAIILLGAGTARSDRGSVEPALWAYGRIIKAAQLQLSCRARGADCRIIVSGGDPREYGRSEAEVYAEQLVQLGIAAQELLVETKSNNTWQNAQFTAPIFRQHRFDRALLVTSGTHLRRASLYFSHFGVDAQPIRADHVSRRGGLVPTGFNFLVADLVLHEYLGIARYHVYNALGWNVTATKPGAL